jgi:hypothetical protein
MVIIGYHEWHSCPSNTLFWWIKEIEHTFVTWHTSCRSIMPLFLVGSPTLIMLGFRIVCISILHAPIGVVLLFVASPNPCWIRSMVVVCTFMGSTPIILVGAWHAYGYPWVLLSLVACTTPCWLGSKGVCTFIAFAPNVVVGFALIATILKLAFKPIDLVLSTSHLYLQKHSLWQIP